MRAWGLSLVLLGASGCTTVWTMEPPAPSGGRGVIPAVTPCDASARELVAELERRLAEVEQGLGAIDENAAASDAADLREERLLLVVRLRELSEAMVSGACADVARSRVDGEALLRVARDQVVAARSQLRDGRDAADDGWWQTGEKGRLLDGLAEDQRADDKPGQAGAGPEPTLSPPPPEEEATEGGEDDYGGLHLLGGDHGRKGGRAAAAVVADADRQVDLAPALGRQAGALQACFSIAQRQRGVALEVVARLTAEGALRVLRLTAETGLTPATSDCVIAAIEPVRLPPGGRSRVVTFPLTVTGD